MPNVSIIRGLSANSGFAREVENQVAAVVARRLIQVAADAEQQTNAIVQAELVTDRSGDRHRPGAHLLGSFRCKIIWNGQGFPIKLKMTSIAPGGAVNSQESGAGAHTIPGPVVFPVAARWGGKGAPAGHSPSAQRFGAAYGKNKGGSMTVRAPKVDHPGNRKVAMMHRGLEAAVQAAYGVAVRSGR